MRGKRETEALRTGGFLKVELKSLGDSKPKRSMVDVSCTTKKREINEKGEKPIRIYG